MNEFTRPSGGSSSFGDCQSRDHGKRSVMPGGHNDRRRQARRWKRPHCFFFPPSDVTSVTPHASVLQCLTTTTRSMEVGQRLFFTLGTRTDGQRPQIDSKKPSVFSNPRLTRTSGRSPLRRNDLFNPLREGSRKNSWNVSSTTCGTISNPFSRVVRLGRGSDLPDITSSTDGG